MSTAEQELPAVRRAYAQQTLAGAKVVDDRLQNAFASVRREALLPPGPWPILQLRDGTYRNTPDGNPAHLYTDDLIGTALCCALSAKSADPIIDRGDHINSN